ncbi:unnamed protein product [Rotaria socialis]|uniref:Uncharacterized protein n=1 Tax=Rotaria socialis TaxID=392032 RepID=A0A821CQZ8_9BILA|nr:unnamed protein product [Rotaria socialis]
MHYKLISYKATVQSILTVDDDDVANSCNPNIEPYSSCTVRIELPHGCASVNETISDNLIHLYSIQYFSPNVVNSDLLHAQTQATINQIISSTTKEFLLFLQMIRTKTEANALMWPLLTNYYLYD